MIFVVDDDPERIGLVKKAFEPEGYSIMEFDNAESALTWSEEEDPDLIVSGVRMPGIGGFAFKESYNRQFPNRQTPFAFLTDQGAPEDLAKGFEMGADDYIVVPVASGVVRTRLIAALKRKRHYMVPTFHGDLGKLPFFKLMQYCEEVGLNGNVEIRGGGAETVVLYFKAGKMKAEGDLQDFILKLYDRTQGTFLISAMPLDFSEIAEAGVTYQGEVEVPVERIPISEKPMGKLSGVDFDKRMFQLQTEFVSHPEQQIQTIVVLDGRVVTKRIGDIPPGVTKKEELAKIIERQHMAVEREVKDRIAELAKKKSQGTDMPPENTTLQEEAQQQPAYSFKELCDMGFARYRERDFAGALELWQQANAIDPSDKTLASSVDMLKRKLGVS